LILNPTFKLRDEDNNIFTIRQTEYEKILPIVSQIVKPVENIGFQIVELGLKDSRFSSGELSRTIKQTLAIKLQRGNSNIDLSIFLPKVIDRNYIVINGRRKIPLFQLFDIPVVTRGETIKLRTNVATLMVYKDKEAPHVKVSFLGKKVALSLLMFSFYGPEALDDRFDFAHIKFDSGSDVLYENLIEDLVLTYTESKGYTQDDFIQELGRNYSRYNSKSKGEDIVYALEAIPQIDVMTSMFLKTGSLIEELIEVIKDQYVDDTLFTNKRVRCFEYMIFAKISKIIFDLCFSNRTSRQPKFNINSNQILSESNVSDIVQFDFSINPIEELTKLSRISLLGPGGFKRENIPKHLRDICPSMFGRICPVDTPDRDNCGVLQNLIPNVSLDDNLQFTKEICEHEPISIPVSMVPFCEHDDQTRLQMASSQMRQSIMLKEFDRPMIQSGCEWLYTDQTQFVKRAKKDGEVIHMDDKFIIVVYNDNDIDMFNIEYRKIYVEHLDFMNVYVKPGDKFKAGEILAESNYCKNGEITFGKNLLTGVMVYYGNNYEDGIVISERLVKENTLTSIHYQDLSFTLPPHKVLLSLVDDAYKPLPNQYETLAKGTPYARIQSLSDEDFYSQFNEETYLQTERKYIISEVKIYANDWNKAIPEFNNWIEQRIEEQKEKENDVKKIILDKFPKDQANQIIKENNLDLYSFVGKYKNKREKINGIRIEISGIHQRPIQVGDKVANRHGNKGIISRIVPQDKMPTLADGRTLDICINPLGIISRMNIGQLFELHLTMAFYDLKKNLIAMLENNTQAEIRKYLLGFIDIIDKTKDKWYSTQFINDIPKTINAEFINNLTLIQPPFESCKMEDMKRALEYTGTMFKQKLYDPVSKQFIENEISVGYVYFLRMVHIAEEKLAARGIGSYAKRTLQPLGGRKNKGGQRCGEMETACIIGHDAPINLFEFLTTKSDCIDLKNRYIRKFTDMGLVDESKTLDTVPESVKLLNSYLTVIGVEHK
jgi:DNA-directed RNA polymerase beta subunit